MTTGNTFQVGASYGVRSMANWDCVFKFEIISRTAKMVTFRYYNEVKRAKVSLTRDGDEYIMPLGRYSMAPMLVADQRHMELANAEFRP